MEQLRFFFVRHGQTYSNMRNMAIGGAGSAPLTIQGKKNAVLTGIGLGAVNFSAAYTSPVARARQTADLLLRDRNLAATPVDDLRDLDWGDLEGATEEEMIAARQQHGTDPLFPIGTWRDKEYLSSFHGETSHDFLLRFTRVVESLAMRHQTTGGNILVVSHAIMTCFFEKISGRELEEVDNTSISIVRCEAGAFVLERVNDLSYLQKGAASSGNSPLTFTLVTDVETTYAARGLLEGQSDSHLTKNGREAARELACCLARIPFRSVYSSPLGRSIELRQLLLPDSDIPLHQDARLQELFLAKLELEKWVTLSQTYPWAKNAFERGGAALLSYRPDDEGEPPLAGACRLESFLLELAEQYSNSGADILVVTHPLILRSYLAYRFPSATVGVATLLQIQFQDGFFRLC